MRVLVIEDEAPLRVQLCENLTREGYVVDATGLGREGIYFGQEHPIDLAIIDLGLPDISGIDVIKSLRAAEATMPILVLTARGRWQDKVEGLESGADDYMVKPFQVEELLARVNALLRRSAGWSQPVLACGPVTLNTVSKEVFSGEVAVELTAYEYRVLEYLMLHSGQVVSKAELTDHIYHQDYDRDSNVIEVFVGRLRKKIDPHNNFKPIETLRGRGYRFTLERNCQ